MDLIDSQDLWIGIGVCFLLGLLAAFVTMKALTAGLRSVRFRQEASGYEVSGSFKLTGQRDEYVGTHTERIPKPKNNKR